MMDQYNIRLARSLAVITLLNLCMLSTFAADTAPNKEPSHNLLLIGGGNVPDNSQGQIELNVNWIAEVIQRQSPNSKLQLLYTDHQGPTKDIKIWRPANQQDNPFYPLARAFGVPRENGLSFRNNHVPQATGSTDKASVKGSLLKLFESGNAANNITLIYNGHGSYDDGDIDNNALKLWGDTRLTVNDFEKLLEKRPQDSTFRFVLTQCFSGAFAKAAWKQDGKVCGFMAESAYREAEGCSTSVNTDDYRDYTTFFYAALDKKTRHGKTLSNNPDRNGDGQVDFREAHLYTLANAVSSDLSRATSEIFLEKWEPWYIRWISFSTIPDNEYTDLSSQIANNLGVSDTNLRKSLFTMKESLRSQQNTLYEKRKNLRKKVRKLRKPLEKKTLRRWPQLRYPYTQSYHTLIEDQLAAINTYITQQAEYNELAQLQDKDVSLDKEMLIIERQLTQIAKIFRLQYLARLKRSLQTYGSDDDQQAYQDLVNCETSGTL